MMLEPDDPVQERPDETSSAALVEQARQGNREASNELGRHWLQLGRGWGYACFARSLPRQVVEDLAMDTIEELLMRMKAGEDLGNPDTLYLSVFRNKVGSYRKRKKRREFWHRLIGRQDENEVRLHEPRSSAVGDSSRTPSAAIPLDGSLGIGAELPDGTSDEDRMDALSILDQLPGNERNVVYLHLVMDLPLTEVARVLDTTRRKCATAFDNALKRCQALRGGMPS